MTRPTTALIDLNALQHNYKRVRDSAPRTKIMAVIKADGYGHGIEQIAKALSGADGLAVASTDEALALRKAGIDCPVFLLTGFHHKSELPDIVNHDLIPVIHCHEQLATLASWDKKTADKKKIFKIWCKIDTGMHRIGFEPGELKKVISRLDDLTGLELVGVMSHLANADNGTDQKTDQQISLYRSSTKTLSIEKSLANSAGIVAWNNSHMDWVRPGIMLYGSSPLLDKTADELDLRPVMKLESEIIAIRKMKKNDVIGYGGEWTCPEDMSVAVVAIGYGDGYPRLAGAVGANVYLNGQHCRVLGRVSMDMITIDLRKVETANTGDKVELWGPNIDIDQLAASCQTISYELMCQVTSRVLRSYHN
jgi:alanine racemase